jgi:hypothetical protein
MLVSRAHRRSALNAVRAVRGQFGDTLLELAVVWVDNIAQLPLPQLKLARKLSAAKRALAVFWYVYTPKGQGNLFIYLPHDDRLLIRELRGALPGERWEVLAVIVRATADAVVQGAALDKGWKTAKKRNPRRTRKGKDTPRPKDLSKSRGADKTAATKASSLPEKIKKKTAIERPATWGFGLGVGYLLDVHSSTVGATHGFYTSVSLRFFNHWALVLDYRVQQQVTGRTEAVAVRINRHPLGLGARFTWQKMRFGVAGRLMLVMDYATYRTEVDDGAPFQPTGKGGGFLWSLAAFVRGRVQVAGPLSAFLSVGLQVALNRSRYIVEQRDRANPVLLNPWVVQPLLITGVCVEFDG